MFNWIKRGVSKLNSLINKPEDKESSNMTYVEYLVSSFRSSEKRRDQITGVNYYKNKHDILKRKKY